MSELGVVDPIRIPEPIVRLALRVPRPAWLFIGAALVDLLGRAVGVARSGSVSVDSVAGLALGIVGRDLLILLPAIVLVRDRGIRAGRPLVFWGLVLIAAAAFLHVSTWIPVDSLALVSGAVAVRAFGWVLLAAGFVGARLPRPTSRSIVAATIVAAVIGAAAITDLLANRASAWGEPFLPEEPSRAVFVIGWFSEAAFGAAWVILAWVLVHLAIGAPSPARTLAAAWAGIWATSGAVVALVDLGVIDAGQAQAIGLGTIMAALGLLGSLALAAAFALGLADTTPGGAIGPPSTPT